jgi:2-oxoglutarate dehydrogenase E2 component (dihydrolipoamide succinyltransferase)
MTVTEATLVEWLVAPGDTVSAGQPIAVIETDKTTEEIEAPVAGRLLTIEETGMVFEVGYLIAEIET